jgi:hypothetical protein
MGVIVLLLAEIWEFYDASLSQMTDFWFSTLTQHFVTKFDSTLSGKCQAQNWHDDQPVG